MRPRARPRLYVAPVRLGARTRKDAGLWGRLAVATLLWIGVPMLLGWVRLMRRELTSA